MCLRVSVSADAVEQLISTAAGVNVLHHDTGIMSGLSRKHTFKPEGNETKNILVQTLCFLNVPLVAGPHLYALTLGTDSRAGVWF